MDPRSFWTSCPHCCHVHQYAREFLNRKLRCRICRNPFAAGELAAPPPVVPGTDMYYCSWGFFPLGFPQGSSPPGQDWTPLIPAGGEEGSGPSADPSARSKIPLRRKICVSKRPTGAQNPEQAPAGPAGFKGIDVNEEARVSDLMADEGGRNGGEGGNGGGNGGGGGEGGGGIGFEIDVDMTEEIFGLW